MVLALVAVFVAGVGVWSEIVRRRRQRIAVVAYEPRRPTPWTAVELWLIFIIYLLLQVVPVLVVYRMAGLEIHNSTQDANSSEDAAEPEETDPERYTAMLLANALGNVLTAAATIGLLRRHSVHVLPDTFRGRITTGLQSRSAATWSDLGLSRPRMNDLTLGLAAFAAAMIPVYGLNWVLVQFTDERHPIVEMLEKHMSFGLMAVSVLSAVVVAPFVEELLFRVALQGWLERISVRPQGDDRVMPWPIVISSLAFALAHLGHGFEPIPLFFLALVLGYLYQRTHRLWPSMVVHFALNSCSMFVLWLQTVME